MSLTDFPSPRAQVIHPKLIGELELDALCLAREGVITSALLWSFCLQLGGDQESPGSSALREQCELLVFQGVWVSKAHSNADEPD